MGKFRYTDIHCHPNLKTFGHSFDKNPGTKSDMWQPDPPTLISKGIHQLTGITKFAQCDFTSMAQAGVRVISLSLYPFEKGFFINPNVTPKLAAFLADWGIEIGYRRVRHLQQHTDYFSDLESEYRFVLNSKTTRFINGKEWEFELVNRRDELEKAVLKENTIAVVISIEGAHVFNCGLSDFGVPPDESEILANIQKVKAWPFGPLFIGLAHNFNNDLCGHARSLQRLGNLVDQRKNLDTGINPIGMRVIHSLLDDRNGRPVYIDLKHMSISSRKEYFRLLKTDYPNRRIPLIASHGSVTGITFSGSRQVNGCYDIFNTGDINFFDEEVLAIAGSGGLLGIQMDIGNNADLTKLAKGLPRVPGESALKRSARIIWNQLQHIALLLDSKGLFAWDTACIGSDFDGSINPFPGILTVAGFEPLSFELLPLADDFLKSRSLTLPENQEITAEEIIDKFFYGNTMRFLRDFF